MSEAARQVPVSGTHTSNPKTFAARAYAAHSATSGMAPLNITRRDPQPADVQIEILFCGVCHSDLHQVRNEWKDVMPTVYPVVPGHEIVGRVVKIGNAVKKFKEGISPRWGVLWIPAGVARIAAQDMSNIARPGSH
jgi:D-arabinose 1-dehydrogenase-like Zn-dependent alcohol dehydrogenase